MYANQTKNNFGEINRKFVALTRETNKLTGVWQDFEQDYVRLCTYWNQHYRTLTNFVLSRTGNMEIPFKLNGLKASMDNCAQNLNYHQKLVMVNLEKIELYMQSSDPMKFYYAWTAITLTWDHLYATHEICKQFQMMYNEFQEITNSFPYL